VNPGEGWLQGRQAADEEADAHGWESQFNLGSARAAMLGNRIRT